MPKPKNPTPRTITPVMAREAVIEAARLGLSGSGRAPRRSNKNPLYRAPTKAGAAWTHLYGACRALSEWEAEAITWRLRFVAWPNEPMTKPRISPP